MMLSNQLQSLRRKVRRALPTYVLSPFFMKELKLNVSLSTVLKIYTLSPLEKTEASSV